MIKKLLRSIIGEFPPKHVHLCMYCRHTYTVVGLLKPPKTSFFMIVSTLHILEMPCSGLLKGRRRPDGTVSYLRCGTTEKMMERIEQIPTMFSEARNKAHNLFQEIGLDCVLCRESLIIRAFFIQDTYLCDFIPQIETLRNKDLICKDCQSTAINYYEKHAAVLDKIFIDTMNKHELERYLNEV